MNDSDKRDFSQILKDAFDIYDKEISQSKLRLYFETLNKYSLSDFSQAISIHISTSQFSPKPADIIEIINSQDGRPDDNQAWSISLPSLDENETVVWTQEMAEAFGAARTILSSGDKVGAKMAFREVYVKLVKTSRELLKPVRWMPSLGHDKARVNDSINQAVSEGKLSHDAAMPFLIDSPTQEGLAIAGLLTGNTIDISESVKQKIDAVKRVIEKSESPFSLYGENLRKEREQKRRIIDSKKDEVEKYVKSKQG